MCMHFSHIETLCFNVLIPLLRNETHIKNTCIICSHWSKFASLWTLKILIHGALEASVISIQPDTNRPDERESEPSFVVKPFTEEKKERTEEAICTWLG